MSCLKKGKKQSGKNMGSEVDQCPGGYWASQLFLCKLGQWWWWRRGGCMPALSAHRWGDGQKWKYLVCSLPLTLSSAHITLVLFFHLFLKWDPFSNVIRESLNAQYCSWHVKVKSKEMRARFGLWIWMPVSWRPVNRRPRDEMGPNVWHSSEEGNSCGNTPPWTNKNLLQLKIDGPL